MLMHSVTCFVHCRTSSNVPHLDLPEELFVEIAVSFGAEANRALHFLQDIACNGDLKQFLGVCYHILCTTFAILCISKGH